MTKAWLPLVGFVIAFLWMVSNAEAQKTCTRVSATSQNCTATLDWTASVADATHDAPASYSIRRADGAGAKTQIGTVNVPVVTFQNVFTDAGNVAHCWDVLAVNTAAPSAPSPQACWTTPVIPPLPSNAPTNLIVR
jgi:hypothetical protein